MKESFNELENGIIQRGLCTVCGTCAGVCPAGAIDWVELDGELQPQLTGTCTSCGICTAACPGADVDLPALERFVFGRERPELIPDLGFYREARVAWSTDLSIRKQGASGGLVTSLLIYALEQGLIDCALLAGFRRDQPCRTEARLATGKEDILASAQSKYACVPVNTLLTRAVSKGYRRLAVVGLPCQIHGLRKLQMLGEPPLLVKSVVLMVGLFCASQFYYEGTRHLLVEHLGLKAQDKIAAMSYRGGDWPGHLLVELKDGRRLTLTGTGICTTISCRPTSGTAARCVWTGRRNWQTFPWGITGIPRPGPGRPPGPLPAWCAQLPVKLSWREPSRGNTLKQPPWKPPGWRPGWGSN